MLRGGSTDGALIEEVIPYRKAVAVLNKLVKEYHIEDEVCSTNGILRYNAGVMNTHSEDHKYLDAHRVSAEEHSGNTSRGYSI